jgi:hypothetical protein
MASEKHVEMLRQGVEAWNAWRLKAPSVAPDLYGSLLLHEKLMGVNLSGANLGAAHLAWANLSGANLSGANLSFASLIEANLSRANVRGASLIEANLGSANLRGAKLRGAHLFKANLMAANLSRTNFREADLDSANLRGANLSKATLCGANLRNAALTGANLAGADLTGCLVYGVSAWGLTLSSVTKQENLVITNWNEDKVTVDNIEVAQLIYLLLNNKKIRDVIDTIGRKGVLLLGRFTKGRIKVLERLREELRKRDFMPIVFNFDKPQPKDFTETVRLLAGLSRFVIVDITNPRSAPLELQATVPQCIIPFVPILDGNDEVEPFAMLRDLQHNHPDRVLPVIRYLSVDRLIEVLGEKIIARANETYNTLLALKAEELRIEDA